MSWLFYKSFYVLKLHVSVDDFSRHVLAILAHTYKFTVDFGGGNTVSTNTAYKIGYCNGLPYCNTTVHERRQYQLLKYIA